MKVVFKILKRAYKLICCRLDTPECQDVLIGKDHGLIIIFQLDHRKHVYIMLDLSQIISCSHRERCRYAECEDYSGDCRMYSGLKHQIPEHQTDSDIKCRSPDMHSVSDDEHKHSHCSKYQEEDIYMGRIEYRDH